GEPATGRKSPFRRLLIAGRGRPLGSSFDARVSRLGVAIARAIGGIVAAGRRRLWSQPLRVERRAGFAAGT
ncbi:hypothetical protein, partial [Achromobacter xylosoxidans]